MGRGTLRIRLIVRMTILQRTSALTRDRSPRPLGRSITATAGDALATVFGLQDRGRITAGFWPDMVLVEGDRYDLPSSAH